jgi:hypothetical protein
MLPMGSKSRRLLNQSTHSSVANSTASNDRHGPRQRTPASQLNWLDTIHHGLPLNLLQFGERPEEYLAFLVRVGPRERP